MLRKNSGITLLTLVFTIIVIIILTSIFIATSLNALHEARYSEIQSEIHSLEEAISIRYTSYLKNDTEVSLVGISPFSKEKLSDSSKCVDAIKKSTNLDSDAEEKLARELEDHFDEYVKIITSNEASLLEVDSFKKDSIYIVDYYTSKAYGPILQEYMN